MFEIILELALGALIGFVASRLMNTSANWWMYILVGVAGSALGRFLAMLVGITAKTFSIGGVAISIAGACLLIYICSKIVGSNKKGA